MWIKFNLFYKNILIRKVFGCTIIIDEEYTFAGGVMLEWTVKMHHLGILLTIARFIVLIYENVIHMDLIKCISLTINI